MKNLGLDIGCGCDKINFRAGSYSGFGFWREILAKMHDIELEAMEGFGGAKEWTEDEPFYELLNHSDCEGVLTPKQSRELQEDFNQGYSPAKLRKLVQNVEDLAYWEEKFSEWKKAIQHSVDANCTIQFC